MPIWMCDNSFYCNVTNHFTVIVKTFFSRHVASPNLINHVQFDIVMSSLYRVVYSFERSIWMCVLWIFVTNNHSLLLVFHTLPYIIVCNTDLVDVMIC